MKWITHQTSAVLAAIALDLPLAGIAAACAGAVLPDMADQRISSLGRTKKQRQKIFNQIHRGTTHWFGWWLGAFLAVFIWPMPTLARDIAVGFTFGALSHVALDMLTTQGVPLGPFSHKHRFSLHLCSTGKIGEYVFLVVIVGVGIFLLGPGILARLEPFYNQLLK